MDQRKKSRTNISRRDFVGRSGIGAAAFAGGSAVAGLGLQAQQRTAPAIPPKWDLEADVVVLGAGACGLPAAIRAADVNFRRMFDSRLTEEYQVAGEPYSSQDASGELAGMAIGASLWGTANQTLERNGALRKRPVIGAQHICPEWTPDSPVFPLVRATGIHVDDWEDLILVNQVGKRFYDEDGQVIQGLYCGGESAGGCSQHGQGRAITQGYIAGKEAANEKSWT